MDKDHAIDQRTPGEECQKRILHKQASAALRSLRTYPCALMLLWLAFLLTYLQGRLINIDKTNCLNDTNFLLLVIQFLIIFSSLCSVI